MASSMKMVEESSGPPQISDNARTGCLVVVVALVLVISVYCAMLYWDAVVVERSPVQEVEREF